MTSIFISIVIWSPTLLLLWNRQTYQLRYRTEDILPSPITIFTYSLSGIYANAFLLFSLLMFWSQVGLECSLVSHSLQDFYIWMMVAQAMMLNLYFCLWNVFTPVQRRLMIRVRSRTAILRLGNGFPFLITDETGGAPTRFQIPSTIVSFKLYHLFQCLLRAFARNDPRGICWLLLRHRFTPSQAIDMSKEKDWPLHLGRFLQHPFHNCVTVSNVSRCRHVGLG